MARTFNNGIGLVLVVDPSKVDEAVRVLSGAGGGDPVFKIGEIIEGGGVEMRGFDSWA